MPEQCLASGVVDAVRRAGQGERTFAEVVDAHRRGRRPGARRARPGLARRRARGARTAAAVRGREPLPARRLRPARPRALLRVPRRAAARLLLEPGLPVPVLVLRRPAGLPPALERAASPSAWWTRSRTWPARYRLAEVFFNDDNFFTDLRRTEAICRGPARRGRARALVRHRPRGPAAPADATTSCALLRESGCYKVNVGAESGSPELLRQIKKGTLVEEVLETAEKLHRARHRRALLVHRRLPAGAAGQPRRDLPDGEGAARDRRRVRDADLLLRAVSGHGAGRAHARARLRRRRERLEEWRDVDLDHSIGPWISDAGAEAGCRATTSTCATATTPGRARARADEARGARAREPQLLLLDLERRAVDLFKRWRTGLDRQQPMIAED